MLKTAASAMRREFSLVPCISLWCKISMDVFLDSGAEYRLDLFMVQIC